MMPLLNGFRLFASAAALLATASNNGRVTASTTKQSPNLPSGTYIFEGTWGSLQCLDNPCAHKQPLYLAHVHGTLTFGDTISTTQPGVSPGWRAVKIAVTGVLAGDDRYRECVACALDSAMMGVAPPHTAMVTRQNGEVTSVGFTVQVLNPFPPNRPRPPDLGFILRATDSGDFEAAGTGFGPIYLRKQR